MISEKDKSFLEHILESIKNIESYTQNINRQDFINKENKMMKAAVIREFEIIGEAVGRLSENIKRENPELPWRDISDMRNKLIHEYFAVNLAVVWGTIQDDLPILKKLVNKIMESISAN